ncbi:helix-turn-helix domain-containing protein [Blastomonas fulva]|uniref:helix-turn-helix domain-containing protein n=1 Tax=Blastomonas fulva TaxID=1550728 RepID=UPI003F6FD0D7
MLNEALRLVRVFHDLNKTQTADRVGLSKSYITELERGDKKVTMEVLEKYAGGFSIPLSSLMFFAEQAANPSPTEKTRSFVAGKALKMLDWIATVTAERDGHEHA